MKRLSRSCYDKFHRCPGWNGGGPHFAKKNRCDEGRISFDKKMWKWRFHGCDKCNVIVWPYVTRYLSIPWLIWKLRRKEWKM